jgi:hypothetical protein
MSDPTLEDLFRRMIDDANGTQIGAVPATVTKYTPATQRCDAKPLAQMATDGSGTLRPLPICREVPVVWPSGAGWAITGPMAVGDIVWLQPAGCDISAWAQNGTPDATDADPRWNSLSDVVALPGLRPVTDPLTSDQYSAAALVVAAASVLLGDSTATDRVGLAGLIYAELTKIETALSTHTHAGVTTGVGTSGTPAAPPYVKPANAAAIGAGKVYAI